MFVTGDKMSLLHKRFIRAWRQSKKTETKKKNKDPTFWFPCLTSLVFVYYNCEREVYSKARKIYHFLKKEQKTFFSNQTVTLFSTRNIISHFSQYRFEIETQRGENIFFFLNICQVQLMPKLQNKHFILFLN